MNECAWATPKLPGCGCAVVKLGGGLITLEEGGGPATRRELVADCARDLVASSARVVLVHGTGAYGKPPAVRYGYLDGRLSCERSGVAARVATELARFELEVMGCLEAGGLKPFRLPAMTLFHAEAGRVSLLDCGIVNALLERGVTPVVGGNFIVDSDGFAVCSSDIIAVDLAIALRVDALILATKARGVYREFGRSEDIYEYLSPHDCAEVGRIGGAGQDVSGGMKAKVCLGMRAAISGIPTYVVDGRLPGNLSSALRGRPKAGTLIVANRLPGVDVGG